MRNVGPAAGVSVGDAKSNIYCSQGPSVSEPAQYATDGIINISPTYQH